MEKIDNTTLITVEKKASILQQFLPFIMEIMNKSKNIVYLLSNQLKAMF